MTRLIRLNEVLDRVPLRKSAIYAHIKAGSFPAPVKLGGASKGDGQTGIVQTHPFTATLPTTGGSGIANDLSTISVQDSAAA